MRVEIDIDYEREQAELELSIAKDRYQEKLRFLDQIEKEYANRPPYGHPARDHVVKTANGFRGIRPAIRDTFPHLKEITRDTIFDQIRKVHPDANIDVKQVDTALRRLLSRGELRRIREASNGHPAVFVTTGIKGSEESSSD